MKGEFIYTCSVTFMVRTCTYIHVYGVYGNSTPWSGVHVLMHVHVQMYMCLRDSSQDKKGLSGFVEWKHSKGVCIGLQACATYTSHVQCVPARCLSQGKLRLQWSVQTMSLGTATLRLRENMIMYRTG